MKTVEESFTEIMQQFTRCSFCGVSAMSGAMAKKCIIEAPAGYPKPAICEDCVDLAVAIVKMSREKHGLPPKQEQEETTLSYPPQPPKEPSDG